MFFVAAPNTPPAPSSDRGGFVGRTGDAFAIGGVLGFVQQQQPAAIFVVETATVTGQAIALTEPFISVGRVISNGVVIPESQYTFDPYGLTIMLSSTDAVTTTSVHVEGFKARPVVTDEVGDGLPSIFRKLTLVGEVEVGCDLESHPTGRFTAIANRDNLRKILSTLRRGTALSILGHGLRVTGIQRIDKRQHIGNEYELRFSLTGKWEDVLDDPIRWREQSADPTIFDRDTNQNLNVFVARAGAQYLGPEVIIPIADDVTSEDATSLGEVLTPSRLHAKGRVIDYSRARAIRAQDPDRVGHWRYHESQLRFEDTFQIDYQGLGDRQDFLPSNELRISDITGVLPSAVVPEPNQTIQDEPDVSGRVIEFANVLLTGDFLLESEPDDSEDYQGTAQNDAPSRWRQVPQEVEISEEGDPNPSQAPFGARHIKDLSVLFSRTGDNKVFARTAKTKDGKILWTERFRYGFQFLAKDIAQVKEDGFELFGNPAAHWVLIEYFKTTYLYDRLTGYFLGTDGHGWQSARFKEESATAPESLTIDTQEEEGQKQLKPFLYFRLPMVERVRVLLASHRSYYADVTDAERFETYEVTLSDGTQATRRKKNPNYVEPLFQIALSRDFSGFASMPDPDSTTENPLPRLTTGKEESSRQTLDVKSGSRGLIFSGELSDQKWKRINSRDRYTQYDAQSSSQDAGYVNSLDEKNFKEFDGRPTVADRLGDRFELVPTENDNGEANQQDDEREVQKRYHLTTPGYTTNDPIDGSISVSDANTIDEAMTAVRLEAYLEQLSDGDSDELTLPLNKEIRLIDKLTYIASGERRKRRVLGYRHTFTIIGRDTHGKLTVTGRTDVSLGRDIDVRNDITLTTEYVPNPSEVNESSTDTYQLGGISVINRGFELGQLIGAIAPSRLRS